MKNLVRLVSLALIAAMAVLGLAACGISEQKFVIGATGPLTGGAATYGASVQKGAQIAVDKINAMGGIKWFAPDGTELGRMQIDFQMKDDEASALLAEAAYYTLYEDLGMKVSIGSVTSGAAKAFATAAKDKNVFCLSPSASADDVIGVGNHSFRVCFGDPEQGERAADELVNGGATKIGVVYDTSDPYSAGLYDAFVARMTELEKEAGTDYVVTSFDKDNKSNFSTQVKTMMDAGCDAIFLPIYYTEAGLIAIEAAKQSFNAPILGCDGLDGVKDKITSAVTASIRYITPFDVNSTDEKVAEFVAAYKAKYNGEVPTQFAADAYDAIMIIYEALMTYNVDPTQSASALTEALKSILTGGEYKYSGLTGENMTWTADGKVQKPMQIVTVQ